MTREPVDRQVEGVELRDEEVEIPLHEEQAVVEKETVAKEQLRVERDVETARETVSDELRKERVEVEDDLDR